VAIAIVRRARVGPMSSWRLSDRLARRATRRQLSFQMIQGVALSLLANSYRYFRSGDGDHRGGCFRMTELH
jgi:hypothetical protein